MNTLRIAEDVSTLALYRGRVRSVLLTAACMLLLVHGFVAGAQASIHDAVREGEAEQVERILEKHPEALESRDERGFLPLHVACSAKRYRMAQLLLEHGADVNAGTEPGGRTPLMLIQTPHGEVMPKDPLRYLKRFFRLLLDHGADVNMQDSNGTSALHLAARVPIPVFTALLIEHGARPDIENRAGSTPLWTASRARAAEVVRFLLSQGADPVHMNELGWTPFATAVLADCRTSETDQAKVTPEYLRVAGESEIHRATAGGSLKRLREIVQASPAALRGTDRHGWTPLHWATWFGGLRAAQILLDAGAPADLADASGLRPVDLAACRERPKIAQLLVQHGVDLGHQGVGGRTALHWAAECGSAETARVLLEAGAPVNVRNEQGTPAGETPLHYAARGGSVAVVSSLLEHGAEVDAVSSQGTPLLEAVYMEHIGIVRILLEHGADSRNAAVRGVPAVEFARKHGSEGLQDLLEGAEQSGGDQSGS